MRSASGASFPVQWSPGKRKIVFHSHFRVFRRLLWVYGVGCLFQRLFGIRAFWIIFLCSRNMPRLYKRFKTVRLNKRKNSCHGNVGRSDPQQNFMHQLNVNGRTRVWLEENLMGYLNRNWNNSNINVNH